MTNRILVYSHDTYGLGNIRRMLTICDSLLMDIPELDILLVSGSPMIHSFRLPPRLDYIKLPCLSRQQREGYAPKTLQTNLDETIQLRAELICNAVSHFRPDVLLVDKKPYGVENELYPALQAHQELCPTGSRVLLLRDILDRPDVTTAIWAKRGYHQIIQDLYQLVLVVGSKEVFNLPVEYQFPAAVTDKVRFCGYLRRELLKRTGISCDPIEDEPPIPYVLVTVGGGEDGYHLLATYLRGLQQLPESPPFGSFIVCGPEMLPEQRQQVMAQCDALPHVRVCEFTDSMIQLMDRADVVVAMGGYNTVCELLSLGKRAIVVPRVRPVEEQWIRAARMAQLGWFQVLHPDRLTPERLIESIQSAVNGDSTSPVIAPDIEALPRITHYIRQLITSSPGLTQNPMPTQPKLVSCP